VQEEGASRLEGLLEIWVLKMMTENVRASTHLERMKERLPDRRSCDIETVGTK